MRHTLHRVLSVALLCASAAAPEVYAAAPESNPVEGLGAKLASKAVTLTHDGTPRGYLMSLLQALEIDPASQMLAARIRLDRAPVSLSFFLHGLLPYL